MGSSQLTVPIIYILIAKAVKLFFSQQQPLLVKLQLIRAIEPRHQKMSMPAACCSLPPVKSDYVPVGKTEKFLDMDVYVVGPADAKVALIGIYDIFGFHKNSFQFCDLLAQGTGFKVVLPDFFRGDACTEEKIAKLPYVSTFGGGGLGICVSIAHDLYKYLVFIFAGAMSL